MNNLIVVLESDNDSAKLIKSYLDAEKENSCIFFDDYNSGMTYIRENIPKVVVFAVKVDEPLNFSAVRTIADLGVNVILVSENYTTSNVVQAFRLGAKDFIPKPIIKKDLLAAVEKCKNENVKAINKSNIISVFSNKGGIGKTAIATNLAVEFARQTREKVVLVDLNLPLGDVTTFINVKPSISMSSAIETASHKGSEVVFNACKQYKDTSLYVLAEPVYMEESSNISPNHIIQLFQYLREYFSYVVVDLSTNVDKVNMKILELSDLILLVSIVNLPLIRNCQRCLDLFANLGFSENKTKIVINRYLENDEIKIEDVEKVLHQNIYWKIPNNYFSIMSSINKAMPVSELNANSNVTLSFSGLASKITEDFITKDIIEG